MNDSFHNKVRAAAMAGWWTLLAGVIIVTLAFGEYLMVMRVKPAWVTCLWGGASWETIQSMWLWAVAVIKLVLWTMFLIVLWLTIWARKLKRLKNGN